VPAELERIVARMLARARADRHRDAAELAGELRQLARQIAADRAWVREFLRQLEPEDGADERQAAAPRTRRFEAAASGWSPWVWALVLTMLAALPYLFRGH
jgi:hypothetical protein